MKKIVVLDAAPLSQNDITVDCLSRYGDLTVYQRTAKKQVIDRIGDAEIVLTNKVIIDKEVIDNCKNLKFISILATGTNVVDLSYAKEKGVIVSNVPSYSSESVAQHTFALYLELCAKCGLHNKAVHDGEWVNNKDFCFCKDKIVEISGRSFGIIGYGSIGKRVEQIAKAFGMNVIINNRTPFEGSVDLKTLLNNADVVSLHCPLTAKNIKMINSNTISQMKDGAMLINTARGGLINEEDLAKALISGKLSGAGLDVLTDEPPKKNNPLLKIDNCIITPHIAWASFEARSRLFEITKKNIEKFLDGKPQNVVNA